MPYITKQQRIEVDFYRSAANAGELNYAITKLTLDEARNNRTPDSAEVLRGIRKLCEDYIVGGDGISYQKINDVIGAITCAAFEYERRTGVHPDNWHLVATGLYFRFAAPYEDRKIRENGDVF